MDIKRALFLENSMWNEEQMFNDMIKDLNEKGIETKIFDRAHLRVNELPEFINWCDSIFFYSTFIYKDQIEIFYKLLSQMPPKKVYGMASGDLMEQLKETFTIEQLAVLSKHEVNELTYSRILKEDFYRKLDMSVFQKRIEEKEKQRLKNISGIQLSGRKILVKTIQAFGKEWENIKEGDILDELDFYKCETLYNRQSTMGGRGVWVQGKTTPVKLINDSGYDEFEFINPGCIELGIEFFSKGAKTHLRSSMATVQLWIYKVAPFHETTDADIWQWCDILCNMLGVERRGNRHYFEKKLQEYRSKYKTFREPGVREDKLILKQNQ